MHTSKFSTELLVRANSTPPLPHSLMNINELLLADLHRLRMSTRTEARKKGFVTYVRHGKIFYKIEVRPRVTHLHCWGTQIFFRLDSSHSHRSPNEIHLIPTCSPHLHTSHICMSQNHGLRVRYYKAKSLKKRIEMLKFLLSTRSFFHIIAVIEIKLDPNLDASSIVYFDNYVLLCRDRNKDGGGFAFCLSIILPMPLFFAYLMVSVLVSRASHSICSVR